MPDPMQNAHPQSTREPDGAIHAESLTKQSAALTSVLAASGITLLKVITGLSTGSLGMLSEAAHSTIDLMASGLTLFSVRVSDLPPDDDHTYGHGRVESLSAFVETVLMLGSSIWIIFEAVRRVLRFHRGEALGLHASIWPVLVLLLSIAVDYTRSRHLARVAHMVHSQALQAEALHFGTDIWSSAAVLIGLAASFAGQRFHIRVLELADPAAALLVSCIILKVTYQLAHETVNALLDATTPEMRRELTEAIRGVNGVLFVEDLRMRRAGARYFADVAIGMQRNTTFQRSEQIVMAATEAVQGVMPGTDVVVRTVPVASSEESVFDRVRAVAQRANLGIHDVTVQQMDGGLGVELHLELPEHMPLREAHETVTHIEADMKREVPEIRSVITHIEAEESTIEPAVRLQNDRVLEDEVRRAAEAFPEIEDVHNIVAMRTGEHLQMSCHCSMPDDLPMGAVHRIISQMEANFLRERPEVDRLLIHPEPVTDNDR
ncbi:cation diffusion facilitator family transporter [Terriglobus roseus]|uniref:Cation diffusion facilitator family transporter n=1 Tax=Terriglobus roseus TaxID=392734 RepID=A0A1H4KZV3_9BACT|nr:cation diffusion facilitator family transporter [Terriglobus roseus]SEB63472.1 cation diffusion facilitator family transporter [Terriglobus roseus]